MDSPILRGEHEAFSTQIQAEFKRINIRLRDAEESIKKISELTISIEKLAINMDLMLKEVANQGKRLESLEDRDGEMWRKATTHIITVAIGLVIGYFFKKGGF